LGARRLLIGIREKIMSTLAYAKDLAEDNIPTETQIRQRAYELYVQNKRQPASALDDWIKAEMEIRNIIRSDY